MPHFKQSLSLQGPAVSRRSLLAGIGALAGGALFPRLALSQASARVVVVGGGWGGISAARSVKSMMPAADVTVVEPKGSFMSCPLSVHYIVGQRSAESLTFDYSAFARDGIRHVREMAMGIDRAAQQVVTESGPLPYDFLVLSPGIDYMEDSIPGFAEHREKLPVGFRAFEQQAVKAALDAYESGNIVLSVPQMPFRCPIAPYERAAMFAEWMQRHNKPGKVILLDQNPGIPVGKPMIEAAFSELYGDRIEHQNGVVFESVNAETQTIETNAGKLSFGMASLVPAQQAGSLIRTAELGGRWAPVSFPTFRSKMDANIYVIGDSVAAKLPKSGHLAYETGVRVAQDITNRVNGTEVEPSDTMPMPSAICFASMSEKEAIGVNVASTYDGFLEEMTSKPRVDKTRTPVAVEAADSWSRGIWNQLLG